MTPSLTEVPATEVDEKAAQSLRCSPAAVRQAVLLQGKIKDAENPSLVLWARIKKAREQEADRAWDSKSVLEAVEQFLLQNPVPAGLVVGICLRSSLRRNAPRLVCNRSKAFSRQIFNN